MSLTGTCSRSFLCRFTSSSIGRKQLTAVTGLLLIGFLKAHLIGNFLLLAGPAAFNEYAHKLMSLGPILYLMEAGLVLLFLTHIFLAFKLTWENKSARPTKYHTKTKTGRGSSFASQTMPYTGFVILAFLIAHLIHFKYGTNYPFELEGVGEVRDLYRTVIEYFASPLYVVWYVFAMAALGIHLSHGVQSSFQSLGWNHGLYTPIIKKLGCIFAVVVPAGFAFLAVWSHFQS